MTISKFELCPRGWHLATVNRDDGGGALLHPVVAWGLTDGGAVVPLVHSVLVGEVSKDLIEADAFDEDDVIGLVQPGDEANPCWNEIADERLVEEAKADERAENELLFAKLMPKLGPEDFRFLEDIRKGHSRYGGVDFAHRQSLLLRGLEHGLVAIHFTSPDDRVDRKPHYHLTELGSLVNARTVNRLNEVVPASAPPPPEPAYLPELKPEDEEPSSEPPPSEPEEDDSFPAF